jgi:hypothetical protein
MEVELVVVTFTGEHPTLLLILKTGVTGATTHTCLVCVDVPHGLDAVSVTVYVPGEVYMWHGFASELNGLPSPKFQEY